jgi:hypothetical protein
MPRGAGGGESGASLYYEISDFKTGMDLRKNVMTAPAGTLRLLQNAHITPGGEIEKRSSFIPWCAVSGSSLGLAALNSQVYVFQPAGGVGTTPPTANNAGVINVVPPGGVSLTQLVSFDAFNGQLYAVFAGSDGNYYHYFNGVQVPAPYSPGNSAGYYVRTYKEKMYSLFGRYLQFSAVGDPTTWQDPPPDGSGNVAHNGSGFINIGANDADSDNLVSMEVYYDKMSIFSNLSTQLWFLDPDPSLNQYYQTLRDAGTQAALSVRQYVANDVYFLGQHGIRSLRARDLSLTAAVADVGSPLDPLIQDLTGAEPAGYMSSMIALLSPRTGRIWMVLPDRIYILSNFAAPNISAWSVYIPEFTINTAVYADPYVVLRGTDNNLYRFGSPSAFTYDTCPVQVTLPFLSFDKPSTYKFYQGFDAICSNTWDVQASFDPTIQPAPFDDICTINGPTMMGGRIPISGRGTHVQLSLSCNSGGPATLSKLFIHYAQSETD